MRHRAWILAGFLFWIVACTSARSTPTEGGPGFLGLTDLSSEQRIEIDQLRRDWQRETLPKMARLRALNVEIHALIAAENPEVPAIQERLDQVGQILTEIQKSGLDLLIRLKKVLNPAQNRQLQDALMSRGEALFVLETLPGFLAPLHPPGVLAPSPLPDHSMAMPPQPPSSQGPVAAAPDAGGSNPWAGGPGAGGLPPPMAPPTGASFAPGAGGAPGAQWEPPPRPREPSDRAPRRTVERPDPSQLRPCDGTPGPCRRETCEADRESPSPQKPARAR